MPAETLRLVDGVAVGRDCRALLYGSSASKRVSTRFADVVAGEPTVYFLAFAKTETAAPFVRSWRFVDESCLGSASGCHLSRDRVLCRAPEA